MAATGRCFCARAGRLKESLEYAARARELGETLRDARLAAWRAMEAEPFMYQGNWEEVVRVAEAALPSAWEIAEWFVILWSSSWLGIAYTKLGRLEDAARVLGRAASEAPASQRIPWPMSFLTMALAKCHLAAGDLERAGAAAEQAVQLAAQLSFPLERGATQRVLAEVLAASGKRAEADAAFRASLEILDQIQSRPELGQTLLAYGSFLWPEDPAAGRSCIERAERLFEEISATGWLAEARRQMLSRS